MAAKNYNLRRRYPRDLEPGRARQSVPDAASMGSLLERVDEHAGSTMARAADAPRPMIRVLATTSTSVDVLLVTLVGLVLLAPLVVASARGRFDPFAPVTLFALAWGAMFVLRPAAMLATDSLVHEGPRRTIDVSGTFTEMLVLGLLGAVGFVLGYVAPFGARLAARHRAPGHRPARGLVPVAAATGLVGLVAYMLVLASDGLVDTLRSTLTTGNTSLPGGSAAMYGSYLLLLLVPASLVLLVEGLDRRATALVLLGAGYGAAFLALMLPLGGRIALLPFVGGLGVLYYVRRSRRPSVAVLAVVALVAIVGSAFLSDLRGRSTRDETVLESVERTASPARIVGSLTEGPDSEMAPALAAALTVIPERLGRTYGTTILGDLVRRPIPRSLWENKPLIPRHQLIAELWPVEYERGTLNPEFSAALYFYWDFGVAGVVVGLMLYGLFFRYVWEYFRRNEDRPYAQIMYALLLWFVVIAARDSPVDVFVRAVFVVGPVWAIFALSSMPWFSRTGFHKVAP